MSRGLSVGALMILAAACGDGPASTEVSDVEIRVRLVGGLTIDPTQTLFVHMTGGGQDVEVKVRRSDGEPRIALGPDTRDFRPTPETVISLGAARNEDPPLVNLVGHTAPFETVPGQAHVVPIVLGRGDRFSRAAATPYDGAAGAVSLADGRVVLFGGARATTPAAIYDHACGEVLLDKGRCATLEATVGGHLPPRLRGASFTPLPGGRLYIYGGENVDTGELSGDGWHFDPAAMSFTRHPAGDARLGRADHAAAWVDAWQRVVIIGGRGPGGPLATAILVDPRTGASEAADLLPGDGTTEPRVGAVAAVLGKDRDGLLLAGGLVNGAPSASALVLRRESAGQYRWARPTAGSFGGRAAMLVPRVRHTLTPLPDGSVLVYGGHDGAGPVSAPEVFGPNAGVPGSFYSPARADQVQVDARERHATVPVSRRDGGVAIALGGEQAGSFGLPAWVFRMGPAGWEVKGQGAPLTAQSLLGPPLPRTDPVAALLPDGSLLVAGGEVRSAGSAGAVELLVECGTFWTCTD